MIPQQHLTLVDTDGLKVQIMEINNLEAYVCQSIPNTIGTLKFEFQDWCYNIRQSIKKVPILKYTI